MPRAGLSRGAAGQQGTMRLVSVVLLVAGLLLALLGPLVWLGRLPVVLGAACVLVAALLAAREGQRVWFALGGLVLAVVLFLAPGLVKGWRNGRGIAWDVPDGEVVELAAAGYAVTSPTGDLRHTERTTLIGRDIDSGARRWQTVLGPPQDPVRARSPTAPCAGARPRTSTIRSSAPRGSSAIRRSRRRSGRPAS
jgi:hypothetical protein